MLSRGKEKKNDDIPKGDMPLKCAEVYVRHSGFDGCLMALLEFSSSSLILVKRKAKEKYKFF
jgi:hypothetical protein